MRNDLPGSRNHQSWVLNGGPELRVKPRTHLSSLLDGDKFPREEVFSAQRKQQD